MRYLQLLVERDRYQSVLDVLNGEGVDYVVTEDIRDDEDLVVVEFPIPAQGVEYLLDALREAGLEDRYQVVLSVETASTPQFPDLEERFVDGNEEDDSIARDEIRTKARELTPNAAAYYVMTVLSAVVATAGLLLDAPAIVVGSMVIAPQVGSALTLSVGTVLNDRPMIVDGMRTQWLGMALAVVTAAVLGVLLQNLWFVPPTLDISTVGQISKRTSPGLLSMLVGVAAGGAGALSLATALPVTLVGVMVAAALIPAAAAIGIGLAWGHFDVTLGAFVLLVMNAASINLTGSVVFWLLDYRPESSPDWSLSPGTARQLAPALLATAVLSAVFLGGGYLAVERMAFANSVNAEVESVIEEPEHESLGLRKVRTMASPALSFVRPASVVVVVERRDGQRFPELATTLERRIQRATSIAVEVEVQYVDTNLAGDTRNSLHPGGVLPARRGVGPVANRL